jgi:hypothetical protein
LQVYDIDFQLVGLANIILEGFMLVYDISQLQVYATDFQPTYVGNFKKLI